MPLSLVLMSASADAEEFKALHEAKLLLQGSISKEEVSNQIIHAVNTQNSACIASPTMVLFLILHRGEVSEHCNGNSFFLQTEAVC